MIRYISKENIQKSAEYMEKLSGLGLRESRTDELICLKRGGGFNQNSRKGKLLKYVL